MQARLAFHAALQAEAALPEFSTRPVSPLAGPGDVILAAAAADRVRELLAGGRVVDRDGNAHERPLQPSDVAVITPHVEQASAVAARLADLPGVLIGTANQAQGLEREAVVVIHPLAGYREAPSFATDPGRLCVALSRHRAHATIVGHCRTPSTPAHYGLQLIGGLCARLYRRSSCHPQHPDRLDHAITLPVTLAAWNVVVCIEAARVASDAV